MPYTLHLGVLDVPYRAPPGPALNRAEARRARRNAARAAFGGQEYHGTTGDVAEILEARYHVIELFVEEVGVHLIEKAVGRAVQNAIADLFSGAPAPEGVSPARDANAEIEETFRHFIDQKELDGVVPGVPTAASLAGVNHRLKRPYAKSNPPRPSFKDTGLYQASFKVWGG